MPLLRLRKKHLTIISSSGVLHFNEILEGRNPKYSYDSNDYLMNYIK